MKKAIMFLCLISFLFCIPYSGFASTLTYQKFISLTTPGKAKMLARALAFAKKYAHARYLLRLGGYVGKTGFWIGGIYWTAQGGKWVLDSFFAEMDVTNSGGTGTWTASPPWEVVSSWGENVGSMVVAYTYSANSGTDACPTSGWQTAVGTAHLVLNKSGTEPGSGYYMTGGMVTQYINPVCADTYVYEDEVCTQVGNECVRPMAITYKFATLAQPVNPTVTLKEQLPGTAVDDAQLYNTQTMLALINEANNQLGQINTNISNFLTEAAGVGEMPALPQDNFPVFETTDVVTELAPEDYVEASVPEEDEGVVPEDIEEFLEAELPDSGSGGGGEPDLPPPPMDDAVCGIV